MKKIPLLFHFARLKPLIAAVLLITGFSAAAQPDTILSRIFHPDALEESGRFRLVFEEDFSGPYLDTTRWLTRNPYPKPYDRIKPEAMNYVLADSLVKVAGGTLLLGLVKGPVAYEGNTRDYAGGQVYTRSATQPGPVNPGGCFRMGRFTARIKLPPGDGLFPAFWLFGWAGEIDILESSNACMDRFQTNIHNHGYNRAQWHKRRVNLAEWNEFTLEWTPYRIDWYFNGRRVRTTHKYYSLKGKRPLNYRDIPKNRMFTCRENLLFPNEFNFMDLILNNGIGYPGGRKCGLNSGESPDTPSSSVVEVDYVQVFQKIPVIKALPESDTSPGQRKFALVAQAPDGWWGDFSGGIQWRTAPGWTISGSDSQLEVVIHQNQPGQTEKGWIEAVFNNPNSCFGNPVTVRMDF